MTPVPGGCAGSYNRDGVVERFRFDGTTYTATRHADGRLVARLEIALGDEVRLHAEAGGWVLRAGTVGPDVLWRRGEDEHEAAADGLAGPSPAYDASLVRRLALDVGERRQVRLLRVSEPVLATLLVDQVWTRTTREAYEALDVATGERRRVVVRDGLVQDGLTLTRL